MNKEDFKTRIINSITFRSKLNKTQTEQFHKLEFTDILLYYIETMPEPKTIREANNQFAWIRKYSWPLIKKKDEYNSNLSKLKEKYKEFMKVTGVAYAEDFTKEEYEVYEHYLNLMERVQKIVIVFENMILQFNNKLKDICELYDKKNLNFDSFCQLINMTPQIAKVNIYKEDREEKRHYYYLFHGVEDDRSDSGWKQNKSNNMPLFHLCYSTLMIMMSRDKEAKQKMEDFILHDLKMVEHTMVIKEDENGNKTLEKYYPPLKTIKP